MLNQVYKLSYRTRIWLSFILLSSFFILATGWASYHTAAKVLQKNSLALSQDTVNKSAQIFDQKLQKISLSMMSLTLSIPFHEAMSDSTLGIKERYYEHLSNFQFVFSQLLFNEPTIQSVMIITPIGDFYPTSNVRLTANSFYHSQLYETIKKERKAIWLEGHEDTYFSGKERVISLVMEGIMNYKLQDVYIMINIKEKDLIHLLNEELSSDSGHFYVLNSLGELALKPSITHQSNIELKLDDLQLQLNLLDPEGQIASGSFEYTTKNATYLVNYYRSSLVPDWTIFRVQSKTKLLEQVETIKWMAIFIISICAIIAFVFSNFLSRLLTLPVNKLGRLMHRVQTTDDMRLRYRSNYHDEISKAGNAFNHMLDRIEHLILEIKDTEHSKRLAEMKALTAQIDPHFFYNTLHTIYSKSVLGENEHVNEMIIALSELFKLGLNNGKDTTTLTAEITHVQKYLVIQQLCYDQLFHYQISKGAGISDQFPILKLLLQPIVENSILHGFKHMSEGGFINISIFRINEFIYIEITDNGDGFQIERLQNQSDCKLPASKYGYALTNIRERLSLYYQDRASLTIESSPGKGTKVIISIPIDEGGNKLENNNSTNGDH